LRRLAAPISFLFAARLVLNTGYRLVYPFLPAISRGLGISLNQGGLLVAARNLAGTATPAVIAGVRPGRNSRRLIVVALALFALGAAVTSATGFFWGALVGFVLMGMGKPAFDVGAMSYLADRTPYERRARILSVLELTWAGSLLVGAPAVGWLIVRNGWEAPFWVISGLAGLAVLASFRLLAGASGEEETGEKNPPIDRSGRVLLLVFILFSTAAELIFVALGSWLELEFGLSIIALGGFAAFLGISELTGEFTTLALADRFGKRNSVMGGIVLAMTGFALIATVGGSLTGALIATGVAFVGFEITIVSALPFATEVQPGARSRYLGLIQVAMAVARAMGAVVGNPLFDRFGIGANAGAAVILNLVALGLLFSFVREHHSNR